MVDNHQGLVARIGRLSVDVVTRDPLEGCERETTRSNRKHTRMNEVMQNGLAPQQRCPCVGGPTGPPRGRENGCPVNCDFLAELARLNFCPRAHLRPGSSARCATCCGVGSCLVAPGRGAQTELQESVRATTPDAELTG